MGKIAGITVPDNVARDYNQGDEATKKAILTWIGRPDAYEKDFAKRMETQYGFQGLITNNAEIKRIIKKAAKEGWTPEMVRAAIMKTSYWKKHSSDQRTWDELKRSDPATIKEKLATFTALAKKQASALGITIPSARFKKIIEQAAIHNTSAELLQQQLAAEARYSPDMTGQFGAVIDQVRSRANDYLIPMSESSAFNHAQKILTGNMTNEGVDSFMRDLAISRWGHLKPLLDAGYTTRELIDSNLEQAAKLLEIGPEKIDVMNDPRFTPIIDMVDPDTGQHRVQTLAETAKLVRSTQQWRTTANGREAAFNFADQLGQMFGVTAGTGAFGGGG